MYMYTKTLQGPGGLARRDTGGCCNPLPFWLSHCSPTCSAGVKVQSAVCRMQSAGESAEFECRVQVRLTEDGKVLRVVVAPTAGVSALQLNLNTQNTTTQHNSKHSHTTCMHVHVHVHVHTVHAHQVHYEIVIFGPSQLSCLGSSAGRVLCLECKIVVCSNPTRCSSFWKIDCLHPLGVLCCFALLHLPCLLLPSFLLHLSLTCTSTCVCTIYSIYMYMYTCSKQVQYGYIGGRPHLSFMAHHVDRLLLTLRPLNFSKRPLTAQFTRRRNSQDTEVPNSSVCMHAQPVATTHIVIMIGSFATQSNNFPSFLGAFSTYTCVSLHTMYVQYIMYKPWGCFVCICTCTCMCVIIL